MLTKDMIIDNKYKILDEIGSGGMSTVYRATVERSGKIWAVKEVKITETDDEIARQCLRTEIEILKNLNHSAIPQKIRTKIPEIADVIDNGDDGMIIIMDYIDGNSLDEVMKNKGPQSEEKVVSWAEQLCEVLGYLHSKKIIYRDMKPSNVMLRKNNEVAIIDFGTAKEYQTSSGETTGLGTAGYAAPEQYGDFGRTDARTDVFCLGMTMYSLLTGKDPRKEFIPDTSILKVNPSFSPGLDQIIRKCTRKDPDERYQSCEELLYYLQNYKIIDKGSRRKKIVKMSLFISCLAVSAISGMCGYLLNLQAKALAAGNYKDLIDSASAITINTLEEDYSEKYDEKVNLYRQAIAIADKSGEKDAYLGILETYKENDGDAPVFTKAEAEEISSLIKTNKSALEANMENYVDICYEIGKLYWYYYDTDNQMTKSIYAVNWFQLVTENADTQNYNQKKLGLAKVYAQIGTFYKKVIDLTTMETIEDSEYIQLFENIRNMVDEIASDSSESDIVRLELLGMARFALRQYAIDFKRAFENSSIENGQERMMKLYEQIALQLSTINVENYAKESQVYSKKTEIQEYMSATEKAIQDAYRTSGKETETS